MRKLRKDLHWVHPDTISLEEFLKQLGDNSTFADNMRHLRKGTSEQRYPEDWMELFARWHDIKFDEGETSLADLELTIVAMAENKERSSEEVELLMNLWAQITLSRQGIK